MKRGERANWQAVHREVLERIHSRRWKPGEAIPNEAELAAEFGCARATVNRALRELAQSGFLDRRRRAGTRVARHPVRKPTLAIPVIRQEIEARGQRYGYVLVRRQERLPGPNIRARLQLAPEDKALQVSALHLADGRPYVLEERWINCATIPQAAEADFSRQSANEWLVENAPFTDGDFSFSAAAANAGEAELLACRPGDALFVVERSTWNAGRSITFVRLAYAPGYRMQAVI